MPKIGFMQTVLKSFLLILLLSFCTKANEIENSADPSNLCVVVLSVDLETKEVQIQATAKNTVEFQLFISGDQNPLLVNQTGFFTYIFDEFIVYNCEIRAYGSSGRYIKAIKQIDLSEGGQEVPLNHGYYTPLTYDGYQMIWQDEFVGNTINTNNWNFNIGSGGWGNNELQYYRSENAWVADDVLTIEARNENYSGSFYTSARLKSEGEFSFSYGRVDIRALLPKGQGIWPALWMLGDSFGNVGWPACGEIDIMELVGGSDGDNKIHGTIHYDNNGHIYTGGSTTLDSGIYADAYHVFSIIWDETSIKWYDNDYMYYEIDITDPTMSEFHQNFWFIMNLAVGGNWPGNPNSSTVFPQRLKIDYIRVFQKE